MSKWISTCPACQSACGYPRALLAKALFDYLFKKDFSKTLVRLRLNEYNIDVLYHMILRGAAMNGYVRAEVFAERWGVSIRQIQIFCKDERIKGATKFGNTWAIPEDAIKPTRTVNEKPGRKPKHDDDTDNFTK